MLKLLQRSHRALTTIPQLKYINVRQLDTCRLDASEWSKDLVGSHFDLLTNKRKYHCCFVCPTSFWSGSAGAYSDEAEKERMKTVVTIMAHDPHQRERTSSFSDNAKL
jgi:hypothetical protein